MLSCGILVLDSLEEKSIAIKEGKKEKISSSATDIHVKYQLLKNKLCIYEHEVLIILTFPQHPEVPLIDLPCAL